jgi:hypothetical protein
LDITVCEWHLRDIIHARKDQVTLPVGKSGFINAINSDEKRRDCVTYTSTKWENNG